MTAAATSVFSGSSAVVADASGMTTHGPAAHPPKTAAALTAVLLTVFAALGLLAHHVVAGSAFDHGVLEAMVAHRSATLTSWAVVVTNLGSPVGVAVLAVAVAALAWRALRSPWPALLFIATPVAAAAISTTTKVIAGAHRPPAALQLVTETDPAFPSGHVTATVALLATLTVVVGHHTGRVARVALIAVTSLAAAAVGLTRLYLGVHWATDVLGGLLLGAAAALIAHLLYQRILRRDGACSPDHPTSVAAAVPTASA